MISAHKIHGPKGTGFLYVGDKVKIRPVYSAAVRSARAALRHGKCPGDRRHGAGGRGNLPESGRGWERMYELRARLEEGIMRLENVRFTTPFPAGKAPPCAELSLRACAARCFCMRWRIRESMFWAGSACASNHSETSGSATLRRSDWKRSCSIPRSVQPFAVYDRGRNQLYRTGAGRAGSDAAPLHETIKADSLTAAGQSRCTKERGKHGF